MRTLLKSVGRDQRGVTSVVVGVSLTALFAATVLAVDMGNLWKTRRNAITATDAAALAEAREIALGNGGCARWQDVLTRNAADGPVTPLTCTVTPNQGSGYVRIEARMPADVNFGGPVGVADDATVFSQSTALWGQVHTVARPRPIALCVEDPHLKSWVEGGPDLGIHPSPGVHRIIFNKTGPDRCGANAPGNWGFVDFDGGGGGNAQLIGWLKNGWDGDASIGDCDGDGSPSRCPADTGSSGGSLQGVLNDLVASGEQFSVIVFDKVSGTGNNVRYEASAFMSVVLKGFLVTGPEAARYLDLEFRRVIHKGSCCVSGYNTGIVDVRLCAVDHDAISESERCTLS